MVSTLLNCGRLLFELSVVLLLSFNLPIYFSWQVSTVLQFCITARQIAIEKETDPSVNDLKTPFLYSTKVF